MKGTCFTIFKVAELRSIWAVLHFTESCTLYILNTSCQECVKRFWLSIPVYLIRCLTFGRGWLSVPFLEDKQDILKMVQQKCVLVSKITLSSYTVHYINGSTQSPRGSVLPTSVGQPPKNSGSSFRKRYIQCTGGTQPAECQLLCLAVDH